MKPIIGCMYRVFPVNMIGKDGKTYPIYTLHASGRDWSSKVYFTPANDKDIGLVVKVLGVSQHSPRLFESQILNGGDVPMLRFSRNPYVRKDGSFVVVQQDGLADNGLNGAYAVHEKRATIYLSNIEAVN